MMWRDIFARNKEEWISDLRNKRWRRAEDREEWREAFPEEFHGSEGAVAPLVDGWMGELMEGSYGYVIFCSKNGGHFRILD